jgi:hypothetical protein
MTTVVKVRRIKPDFHYNFTLYIGREWAGIPASKWQNPFHLRAGESRGITLAKYEAYLRSHPELMAALHEIDDQILGCWCHETPSDGSGVESSNRTK